MFLKFKFKFKSFCGIFLRVFLLLPQRVSCMRKVLVPTLPQPNIDPSLLSVDCCWVRGGVGA